MGKHSDPNEGRETLERVLDGLRRQESADAKRRADERVAEAKRVVAEKQARDNDRRKRGK